LIDVANEAGVSRATASLVIRNSPLVAAATRLKVEAAMEKLGYVYNLTAARLRAAKSRIVGVVVPNLVNPFFAEFLIGIEAVINKAGLAVLFANSDDDPSRQLDVMTRMREHGVDGLIICPADGTKGGTLSPSDLLRMPVVQVLRHVRKELDYVGPDYSGGVHAAVDHLVALGHRHISYAVYRANHTARSERIAGFIAAMEKHGLSPELIHDVPNTVSNLPASASALLALTPTPTATLCFNDLVAYGLSAGLLDLGLTAGRDYALIGFDDVMNSEIARPRLTSVSTHPSKIGQMAAQRLLGRMADKLGPPQSLISETNLIVRQSCGFEGTQVYR
jgi:LacI family transcriptional regulator